MHHRRRYHRVRTEGFCNADNRDEIVEVHCNSLVVDKIEAIGCKDDGLSARILMTIELELF